MIPLPKKTGGEVIDQRHYDRGKQCPGRKYPPPIKPEGGNRRTAAATDSEDTESIKRSRQEDGKGDKIG